MTESAAPATIAPADPTEARYFNRELSWLAFNRRVMEEACNPAHPLLERLRFLSISGSNFDEFFMVRVAGLMGQQLQNIDTRSADGLTPAQQLEAISAEAATLADEQQAVWVDIRAELALANIFVLEADAIEGRPKPGSPTISASRSSRSSRPRRWTRRTRSRSSPTRDRA